MHFFQVAAQILNQGLQHIMFFEVSCKKSHNFGESSRGTIIKMWKQLWNLAKTVKKATLPLKKKKSKTTLRKRSSKTGFSLPATAFEISFDVFEQPFWLLLRHNSGEREDFVFCKLDDKYVSISCCLSQTPRRTQRCGWKVSAGIVVATEASATTAIPFGLL